MQFLVEIQIDIEHLEPRERVAILLAERLRGQELKSSGAISQIWRIGDEPEMGATRFANVGVWNASSEQDLSRTLSSLPLFSCMDVKMTPLSPHPLGTSDNQLNARSSE